jgi:3-dehydroquinate synthase
MKEKSIRVVRNLTVELQALLETEACDRIFVLTDENTRQLCYPRLRNVAALRNARLITIPPGDVHKELSRVVAIWDILSREGASRRSLLINLGGGMVTDLGGFAGATFKRGLHTLNIPTTLMAAVDAAVGGKTGINFNGLKNEIGAFHLPDYVLIDGTFLQTLDGDSLLSGYAEMIKHGLISSEAVWSSVLAFEPDVRRLDVDTLNRLIAESVAVKEQIVAADPKERGVRKALNLGHTVGHAFESLSFERRRPLLHGHAVAAGLIAELYLSHRCCGFPLDPLRRTVQFIRHRYPPVPLDCKDYERLHERMTHDKKNEHGRILFALLSDIGRVSIDCTVEPALISEALDFYREGS